MASYRSGGFDSLTAKYEAVRKEYYGSDTYNLGESVLPDLGDELKAADSAASTIKLAEYNLKWFPNSGYTYLVIGRARNRLGEREQGIKDLQHAAELDPTLKDFVQRIIERMPAR